MASSSSAKAAGAFAHGLRRERREHRSVRDPPVVRAAPLEPGLDLHARGMRREESIARRWTG